MTRSPARVTTDPFIWHEALDRCALVQSVFNEYVADSPAVCETAVLAELSHAISELLADLYRGIADRHPEFKP